MTRWEPAGADHAWPPGYSRPRWTGYVRRGDTERTCGHAHKSKPAAQTCADRTARRLNREAS